MPGGNKGEGNVSTGLYHFGERYYDPTTGRWTQQDREDHLGSATQGNRFLFADSDPINLNDPTGFSTESRLVSAGGYVAGGAACIATGAGAVLAGVCAGVGGYIAEELFEPEEVF
jgi:RHS repeat-associated protein